MDFLFSRGYCRIYTWKRLCTRNIQEIIQERGNNTPEFMNETVRKFKVHIKKQNKEDV